MHYAVCCFMVSEALVAVARKMAGIMFVTLNFSGDCLFCGVKVYRRAMSTVRYSVRFNS
jgi:hypothetical protein